MIILLLGNTLMIINWFHYFEIVYNRHIDYRVKFNVKMTFLESVHTPVVAK